MLSVMFVGYANTSYNVPLFVTVSKFADDGLVAIGLLKVLAAEFGHNAVAVSEYWSDCPDYFDKQ